MMKNIKIKILKKVIKDARKFGIKDIQIVSSEGDNLGIYEITSSAVTGIRIRLK